eukprot:TRINITY_DN10565_c0_g1_i1.p1 TRINITY_DN10565_c0_g1~~TRINITY_DN10565_c0_g1_i1.p1  ORF type:complete len:205 (+),score=95.67 TRINITY_DN10565_c0_g1_i1:74-688(+)
MGCFFTSERDPSEEAARQEFEGRWWAPSGEELPNILSEGETRVVRELWESRGKKGADEVLLEGGQKLLAADKERRGSRGTFEVERQVRYIAGLVNPVRLSVDGILGILSVVLQGSREEQALLFFQTIDRDENGFLDKKELAEVLKLVSMHNNSTLQGQPNYYQMADEILRNADADSDGLLSKQEFLEAQDLIVERLVKIDLAVM